MNLSSTIRKLRALAPRTAVALIAVTLAVVYIRPFSVVHGAELQVAIQPPPEPGARQEGVLILVSNGEAISGVQVDLIYDPDRISVEIEGTPALEEQQKTIATSTPERGILRILVIGENANPIADSPFVRFYLTPIGETTELDRSIRLVNPVATTPEGQNIPIGTSVPSESPENLPPEPNLQR